MKYDFDGLFVLDMANNHCGDVERGKRIIDEVAEVVKDEQVRAAIKFQFRDLETLVHEEYKDEKPYPKRFFDTALGSMAYGELAARVREHGLITMATPFDENSVKLCEDLEIEVVKIASCSATDWPLILEAIELGKPMVISTAGLQWRQIDDLVNLMWLNAKAPFALNHCVALYPTTRGYLQLNQIKQLKERYPEVPIGFSTHEAPMNFDTIGLAYALGARFFECHVDVRDWRNAYSRTPEEVRAWLCAYRLAKEMMGAEHRPPPTPEERKSLDQFKRGVYYTDDGQRFFAIPRKEGVPTVEQFYAKKTRISGRVPRIMLQVYGMLRHAQIALGPDFKIELSHHYGLAKFREFGAVIISCVNRTYAKKLLVQLPRQKHPYHYHKKKEETFLLLWGDMDIEVNGMRNTLAPGDQLTVLPGEWHKFSTLHGAVVEEISTTDIGDSVYEDEDINLMERADRKTEIDQRLMGKTR